MPRPPRPRRLPRARGPTMGRPGSYPEFFASRLVCCWWVLGWEPEEVASHWFVGLSTVKRMIARFEAGQERLREGEGRPAVHEKGQGPGQGFHAWRPRPSERSFVRSR